MIPVRNIPDKARSMYIAPPPRYPYRLHINQMEPGILCSIPLLLPEFYDPAFLRFQSNVPVYCSTICVELMQENVAGLGKEDALVDLYLLIDTFPEGQRPMTD
jgi:hypothetical protein